MAGRWLTATEAADRLSVQRATLYAYVSRGMLASHPAPTGRGSRFDAEEVEALARKARRADRPAGLDIVIATAVTRIHEGRLTFRGHDACALAGTVPFEAVAGLLWTGELTPVVFTAPDDVVAVARTALAALPDSAHLTERFHVAVAAAASADPLRFDLAPASVISSATTLVTAMVDALPRRSRRAAPARRTPLPLARRLWAALSPAPGTDGGIDVLDAALVLMADHELATSTLAARVAASTRANPYAVVTSGLGALQGPLHGSASIESYRLFLAAAERGAAPAVGEVLRAGGRVPGFGHMVYGPEGDPRAPRLLSLLEATPAAAAGRFEIVQTILDVMVERAGVQPNVDFALGAMVFLFDLPPDAGEAVFAVARVAGWIAHALEEYEAPPLRYRARALAVDEP